MKFIEKDDKITPLELLRLGFLTLNFKTFVLQLPLSRTISVNIQEKLILYNSNIIPPIKLNVDEWTITELKTAYKQLTNSELKMRVDVLLDEETLKYLAFKQVPERDGVYRLSLIDNLFLWADVSDSKKPILGVHYDDVETKKIIHFFNAEPYIDRVLNLFKVFVGRNLEETLYQIKIDYILIDNGFVQSKEWSNIWNKELLNYPEYKISLNLKHKLIALTDIKEKTYLLKECLYYSLINLDEKLKEFINTSITEIKKQK